MKELPSSSIITMEKRQLWIHSLKKRCAFATNSYIEPYRNQLKSYYFSRTRNTCVDRMTYVLLQVVSLTINKTMYMFSLVQKEIFLSRKDR
jgi:hypothetical protein